MLPSLANGTILVANAGLSPWSNNDPHRIFPVDLSASVEGRMLRASVGGGLWSDQYPRAILAVDPSTGTQSLVSMGGFFSEPTYIREAPDQQLYVTDLNAFPSIEKDDHGNPLVAGAVIAVDPKTGQQRVVAKGTIEGADGQNHPDPSSYINGPNTLVFMNGGLYVANEGDSSGTIHNIVQVDPNTGAQELITDGSGGGFSVPVGMVGPAPFSEYLYVVDEPGNVQGTDPGTIWEVNVVTGQQTILAQDGLLGHPMDVAREDSSGDLIVATTGSQSDAYAGSIVRVNTETGAQTLVTSFGADSGINSVAVSRDDTILVGAIAVGSNLGHLIAVNPLTGAQSIVTSGGSLSLVEGIAVFRADSESDGLVLLSAGPHANQLQADNADLAPMDSPEVVMAQVQVQAVQLLSGPSPLRVAGRQAAQPVAKKVVDSLFADWARDLGGDLYRLEDTNC